MAAAYSLLAVTGTVLHPQWGGAHHECGQHLEQRQPAVGAVGPCAHDAERCTICHYLAQAQAPLVPAERDPAHLVWHAVALGSLLQTARELNAYQARAPPPGPRELWLVLQAGA